MLRKLDKYLSLIQQCLDFTVVILMWFLAYFIRFDFFQGQQGLLILFAKLSFLIGLITVFSFQKFGLYKSQRFTRRGAEITAVFFANLYAHIFFIIVLYFFAETKVSRIFILTYALLSTFTLTFVRIVVRNYLRHLRKNGRNLRHYLLIGDGSQIEEYIKAIRSYKDCGIKIIGWLDSHGKAEGQKDIKDLGNDFSQIKERFSPDSLILSYSHQNSIYTQTFLQKYHNDLIPIQILPDLPFSFVGNKIDDFAGVPILNLNRPNISDVGRYLKRIFDITACSCGLILLSPFLFIISIVIKLTSPGPILYKQERIGLDGQNFFMLKFRTMRIAVDNEDKNEWSNKDNPRKTVFGNFLRKSSLDELPQLLNVIKGEMSLVGPRPERPFFVEKFKDEIPAYMLRHKMKAGLTGWAQVNGWRGDTCLKQRIACDLYYIRNWSFWFDIKIIFLTLWKGLFNKNAY
ncbi:MAG: undecaprenyl-phosphate glucose phosphotransferase [Halobacteriovoraceae bacterium]|nr:undecaprenyl-phosphate glucose phosphotransferase [Halobacteriovoraceae bacterium]